MAEMDVASTTGANVGSDLRRRNVHATEKVDKPSSHSLEDKDAKLRPKV
jgi:hypothetical protein